MLLVWLLKLHLNQKKLQCQQEHPYPYCVWSALGSERKGKAGGPEKVGQLSPQMLVIRLQCLSHPLNHSWETHSIITALLWQPWTRLLTCLVTLTFGSESCSGQSTVMSVWWVHKGVEWEGMNELFCILWRNVFFNIWQSILSNIVSQLIEKKRKDKWLP